MERREMVTVRRDYAIVALVAVALCAAAILTGSPAPLAASSSPSAAPDAVTLRIGWTADPDNLSPFIGVETAASEVLYLTYDRLFGFGLEGKPIPQLVAELPTQENGGISADGLTWTVHIRPGVTWQDGAPLTAADVAFSYNVIIQNKLTSYLQAVKDIKEVEAVDDTTVRFTMSAPKADMLYVIVYIIPEHIWGKVKVPTLERSYANKTPIVGSGPFQVTYYKRGDYTELVRNPDYWGNDVEGWGRPKVDRIIFQAYTNPDTMTQDLRTGAVDAAQGVPSAQFPGLQGDPTLETIDYNYFNWDYVDFNCYDGPESGGNPVLRDPAFRVALDYAIDRERIVQLVYNGRAKPGYTMINADTWRDPDFHWEPPAAVMRPFDPAEAEGLLDAAGYRDTDGDGIREDKKGKPITLRLWALAESTSTQAEGKLLAGWFEDVGLKIRFEVVDNGVASDAMYAWKGDSPAPDYDMILWFWDGYYDPGSTLQCFTTSQVGWWNEVYWSNAEYDELCEQQGQELDAQKRAEQIWRMQEVMYAENPQNVLTYFDYLQAVNTERWEGWTPYYGEGGPVFYNGMIQSYLNVGPRAGQDDGAGGEAAGGKTGTIAGVSIAVLLVTGVLVWWVVRRRGAGRAEEA
ncbi:MAG: ABC transporter substrate-binding protein [Actinobacteria bacterium]|nr:ABC transporter substrate-binding protein [Actinomycetota bacterium]